MEDLQGEVLLRCFRRRVRVSHHSRLILQSSILTDPSYYWFPGTIMPVLTFFNWMTWIRPTSAVIAIVTGTYYYNLGFNPIPTLDYQWFARLDPFVTPFFVMFQVVICTGLWALLVIIPVFFSNTWFSGYLPINSWLPYDNTGQEYDTSLILGSDGRFNQTAYEQYSPVFLPASVMLRYTGMLAMMPALLVFTHLYYRKIIYPQYKKIFRRSSQLEGMNDIHSQLMRRYKEVPEVSWPHISYNPMS